MQSRTQSFVEAVLNLAVGLLINLGGQFVIFPILDIPVTLAEHLWITLFFTILSLARSYVLRRWFNGLSIRKHA